MAGFLDELRLKGKLKIRKHVLPQIKISQDGDDVAGDKNQVPLMLANLVIAMVTSTFAKTFYSHKSKEMFQIELTRVDYNLVGLTNKKCMKLLPMSSPNSTQKVGFQFFYVFADFFLGFRLRLGIKMVWCTFLA